MPYNANIPQANDQLSVSQGQILANFTALAPLIPLTTNGQPSAIEGFNFLLLQDQLAVDPATTATETAIYQKANNLYWRKQSSGTVIGLTAGIHLTIKGFSTLGSGQIINWGNNLLQGANPTTVTFQQAFQSTDYVVTVTPTTNTGGNVGQCFVINKTVNNCQVTMTNGTVNSDRFDYIAVGF